MGDKTNADPIVLKPRTKTKAEIWALQGRQIQVVNFYERHRGKTDHESAAMFYQIARYVPEPIIYEALAALEDFHDDVISPTKYYIGTVRGICQERGIETPINWRPKT